jgi:cell division septum initiation protein DivIVA
MPAIAHTPRRPADMVTHDRSPGTDGVPEVAYDQLLEENVRLVSRISQLRCALEAASRDNVDLRRMLARVQRESHQLRQLTPARVADRPAQWSDAMTDRCSRNP